VVVRFENPDIPPPVAELGKDSIEKAAAVSSIKKHKINNLDIFPP